MKKYKLEVTSAQLYAIANMANDMEAMLGGSERESDKAWRPNIRLVDRMLKANGLKRDLSGIVINNNP